MNILKLAFAILFGVVAEQQIDLSVVSDVTRERPSIPRVLQIEEPIKPIPDPSIQPLDDTFDHIPSKKKPKWNLEGSWTLINNRLRLIEHLAEHPNHGNSFKREHLNKLTLGQLWWVHDNDHDGKKVYLTRPKVKGKKPLPKEEPYCPPGKS